jgi:hypothetical protein
MTASLFGRDDAVLVLWGRFVVEKEVAFAVERAISGFFDCASR